LLFCCLFVAVAVAASWSWPQESLLSFILCSNFLFRHFCCHLHSTPIELWILRAKKTSRMYTLGCTYSEYGSAVQTWKGTYFFDGGGATYLAGMMLPHGTTLDRYICMYSESILLWLICFSCERLGNRPLVLQNPEINSLWWIAFWLGHWRMIMGYAILKRFFCFNAISDCETIFQLLTFGCFFYLDHW
jgi:hypothetical protein